MEPLILPLPTSRLMPQAEPMRLVEELNFCEDGNSRGWCVIDESNLFLNHQGVLDSAACVEILAQVCASMKGYESLVQGKPIRYGYLVGVKDFVFHAKPAAGDRLDLHVHRDFMMDAAVMATGRIMQGDARLVEGVLKIFETDALPPHPMHPALEEDSNAADCTCLNPPKRSPVQQSLIDEITSFDFDASTSRGHCRYRINDAFVGFQGHFPDYPLQPGVCTLQMGLLAAGLACGCPLEFKHVEQAKFSKPVYPNEEIDVEVRMKGEADDGSIQASARITRGPEAVARYSFCAEKT
ncbi:MAG: hypothetical protein ACOC54_05730 [Candidatus Sumerlaeota bacterium]